MSRQRTNELTGDSDCVPDSPSNINKICVILGSLLNVTSTPAVRLMPLSLNNGLPASVLRFGSTDDDKVDFPYHIDSYAAMNTANILLHWWVITTYLDIMHSYEQFDDSFPFNPLELDYVVPNTASNLVYNKLTAVVTYKIR